jgi:hypothetical protein
MAHASDSIHAARPDDLGDLAGEGIGPQEIDAGPVSVVVCFGAATTLILIFLTIMFFKYMEGTILETKGLNEPDAKVKAVVDEQHAELAGYGAVDSQGKELTPDEKGVTPKPVKASIPIEAAMAMIVEQRTKDPNPKIVPMADPKKTDAKKEEPKKEEPKKDEPKKDAKGK